MELDIAAAEKALRTEREGIVHQMHELGATETGDLDVYAGCINGNTCEPTSQFETNCDDGVDNDCDGFIDRRDVECIQ